MTEPKNLEYGALLEMSMHLQELCKDPMVTNISETSLTRTLERMECPSNNLHIS